MFSKPSPCRGRHNQLRKRFTGDAYYNIFVIDKANRPADELGRVLVNDVSAAHFLESEILQDASSGLVVRESHINAQSACRGGDLNICSSSDMTSGGRRS